MPGSPSNPFSKRYGYSGQAREITIREDAPESLRCFVFDTARKLGLTLQKQVSAGSYWTVRSLRVRVMPLGAR